MNWKKALILVPAGILLLIALFFVVLGIKMVCTNPPGHHDFKEGLLALIPGSIMSVLIALATWGLLKLDWVKGKGNSEVSCPSCGYNMAGLSQAKCPECGHEFTLDQLTLK
jgi:DNA-directed RNA polymerase subunit RPC12/RpoP